MHNVMDLQGSTAHDDQAEVAGRDCQLKAVNVDRAIVTGPGEGTG